MLVVLKTQQGRCDISLSLKNLSNGLIIAFSAKTPYKNLLHKYLRVACSSILDTLDMYLLESMRCFISKVALGYDVKLVIESPQIIF
jgi:hypothetical protein